MADEIQAKCEIIDVRKKK